MSYQGILAALVLAAGCASAGSSLDSPDASTGGTPDAGTTPDGSTTPPADAPPVTTPDAPPPGCTMMTRNLLVNGSFDTTPMGMGWTETPIDAMYPIVTADGTLVQSSPNKAWMGGFEQAASDALNQDVTIPASTTTLALSGYYEIRTGELPLLAFDSARIELTTTAGAVLQTVMTKTNLDSTTAWTPFTVGFATTYAGQTIRLRMSTTSDATNATSFYFDTLALTATYCE